VDANGEPRGDEAGDRRRMERYPALRRAAWVGWPAGEAFRAIPASLVDISQGGCLAEVWGGSVPERPVLLRLDGDLLPHWFGARIIGRRRAPWTGRLRLRLVFPEGCPYALFVAVVFGRAAGDGRDLPPVPEWVYEGAPGDEAATEGLSP
jgi:hypothetical protein